MWTSLHNREGVISEAIIELKWGFFYRTKSWKFSKKFRFKTKRKTQEICFSVKKGIRDKDNREFTLKTIG